jgi:hypothetical protein
MEEVDKNIFKKNVKKKDLNPGEFVFCKGSVLKASLFMGDNAKKSIEDEVDYFVKKDFIPGNGIAEEDKINVDDDAEVENAFYKIRYLILSYYK